MSAVNIVIALGLADELIKRAGSIDSRVKVTRLTPPQLRVYREGRKVWYEPYEVKEPERETPEEAEVNYRRIMSDCTVLFSTPIVPTQLEALSPNLRWIQSTAAGADRLQDHPIARNGKVVITTASGVHAIPISEYVLGAILTFCKGFPAALRTQTNRAWKDYLSRELCGQTLGVLGLGSIGNAIVERARPFGLRILAMRRSVEQRSSGAAAGRPEIAEVLPPSDLEYLLRQSDYVAISMPLTDETHHLLGERQLAMMKPNAVLINISRGPIVDEQALIRALREKTIAGAALDVFDKEPLPAESEFWDLPNVILTPHASGSSPLYMSRAIDLLCDNVTRLLKGEPLRNVMDPHRGY
ncbi:MAG TPA: D-2-hydroxyacid dehydrogenase [Dehalococcoidia bacterium]|nr:D-2-hydroxyacid dehydrogenase [Dehalococcoidia bacterium]